MYRGKILLGIAVLLLSEPSNGKTPRLVDFEGGSFEQEESPVFPGEFEGEMPPEDNFSQSEVIDISSKLKGRLPMSRNSISMVHNDPNEMSLSVHSIKDETATTGENAKKTLPSYLRQKTHNTSSPLLYDIHSMVMNPVLASLIPRG